MTEPSGITIPSPGTVWVTDTKSSRLEEFKTSTSGPFSASFVRAVGFGVENGEAKFETCATSCKAGISGASVGEFTEPAQIASYQSKLYVAGHQSADITVLNEKGESPTTFGTHGKDTGELEAPTGIAADTSNGSILVADDDNDRVLDYTPGGQFVSEFGTAGEGTGQFKESYGVTAAAGGGVYVVDHDLDRVSKWWPQSDVGNPLAHTKKTSYYTEAANASYPECGGHVEWQGLVCQTRPEAQPEITGTPSLPITTITYDMWDQAERTTEEFPAVPPRAAVTRTKVTTFEPSGRPTRTELTSSVGQPVPTATISYNSANGTVEKETATINKAEHTIVSTYNTLGALETYTDGSGENTAHYTYDIDGRISSIADSADAGTGEQKYTYSTSTGELEKLEDSSAHVFEAAYNSAGDMTSETYPDGMVASTTYDPTGAATSVAYMKTSDCSPECVLCTDSDTASIHGGTLEQTSSLAKSVATYDETGRLLSMQETPAGEGCKTRVYTYDEEGNRLSQSEYEPGTGGACATEHGSQTLHEYTTANDLADPGVDYDSFGNITTLPAADGGGTETKAAFYVNNQAYTEAQGSTADAYTLDPADRTFQTTSGTTTSTSHYDGPGNALSWTSQTGGGWARDIPGIGGTLAAVQTSTTAPILQIHNLAGQTVATIGDSPTETKLLSTHNPTEFGASQPAEKAPEYGWLGQGLGSEFPSGSVVEDGSTYIPLIGKPLQGAPIDVTYAPNEIGEFTDAQPPWAEENAVAISEEGIAEAEEARKAAEAAEAAGGGGGAGAEEIVVGTSEDEDGDGAQIASAGCPNYKVVVTSGQNEACTGSGKLIVDWEEVGIGDSGPVVHASVKAVTVQHGATLRITVGQYGPDLPEGAKYVDSGKIPGGRTFSDQNTYTLEVGDELVFQLEEEYKGKISYGRVVLGVAGG